MIVQYKCSNCGSDMLFDTESGKLHCDSCGNYEEIGSDKDFDSVDQADLDYDLNSPPTLSEINYEYDDSVLGHSNVGDDEASEYQCNNCGAVLLTDKDTTATSCTFCNAPMILSNRLSGNLAPVMLIPFTISKNKAIEAFKKWSGSGLLTPKSFRTADRIKELTGLYVPFWLYDLNGKGDATAVCTRVRKYTRGDYIYTETKYYNVYRKVDLNYSKVPADASAKLDDSLMDKLEPFNYSDLKDFNMPYLAGYLAETYNYDAKELFPRIKQRVNRYLEQYIRSTIVGYDSVSYTNRDITIRNKKADYVLFPIWMLSYNYKGEDYIFAMNGQTGKVVGKPPLSKGRMFAWFSLISLGTFLLLNLIAIIGGGA